MLDGYRSPPGIPQPSSLPPPHSKPLGAVNKNDVVVEVVTCPVQVQRTWVLGYQDSNKTYNVEMLTYS